MDFKSGMKVEVCSNEEGYRGAWFEGTVVSYEGGGIHKVRHEKFQNERNKPLEEDFHSTQIRPRPPKINVKNWKVNDPVEIYDNHCWWKGAVSELLPDGYYSVHFPEYGEKVYHKSAMRSRKEWHDGKWSRPRCLSLQGHNIASNGKKRGAIEKQLDNVAQNPPVKRIRVHMKGLSEGAGPSGGLIPRVSGSNVSSSSKGKSLEVREELSDLRIRVAALEDALGVMQRQLNVLSG